MIENALGPKPTERLVEELGIKFEDFYKKYYKKLFIAAFRLTGNKEDAEDVIQETYLH